MNKTYGVLYNTSGFKHVPITMTSKYLNKGGHSLDILKNLIMSKTCFLLGPVEPITQFRE